MAKRTEWARTERPRRTPRPRFFGFFKNLGMVGDRTPAPGYLPNRADRRRVQGRGWAPGRLVLHNTRLKARPTGRALASPTSVAGKAQRAGGTR
jgi:hypothetical protein